MTQEQQPEQKQSFREWLTQFWNLLSISLDLHCRGYTGLEEIKSQDSETQPDTSDRTKS